LLCAPKTATFSGFFLGGQTFRVGFVRPAGFSLRGVFFEQRLKVDDMQPNPSAKIPSSRRRNLWLVPLSLVVGLLIWQIVTMTANLPSFILPSPGQVFDSFWQALTDGRLLYHTAATLTEILLGLLTGSLAATCLGYLIAKSRTFERVISPYLVASQAVPVVAIAPLLVIWFGPGMFSKVLISALIVFFPVLVNTVVGIRAVPPALHDLMQSLRANRSQTLRYLEIPAALPVFLGGLRIGATLSVIGAVVGEFVGADRGLGFLINVGRGQYDTALVFVAIFTLVAVALSLYGLVSWAESRLLVWQETFEN
jgi:NitT/TauT family transport system permease protein